MLHRLADVRQKRVSSAPKGILVAGATGKNAYLINGHFELGEGTYNHAVLYQQVTRSKHPQDQGWLRLTPRNRWVFGDAESKKNDDESGACRSMGAPGDDPSHAKHWNVLTARGRLRQNAVSLMPLNAGQWQAFVREHEQFYHTKLTQSQLVLRLRIQAEIQRAAYVHTHWPHRMDLSHLMEVDRRFVPLLFGHIRDIPRIWDTVMAFYNPDKNPAFNIDDSYKLVVMREHVIAQNSQLRQIRMQLKAQAQELDAVRAREATRDKRLQKMEALFASLVCDGMVGGVISIFDHRVTVCCVREFVTTIIPLCHMSKQALLGVASGQTVKGYVHMLHVGFHCDLMMCFVSLSPVANDEDSL